MLKDTNQTSVTHVLLLTPEALLITRPFLQRVEEVS